VAQAAALVKENIENQGPTYDEYDDDDMDDEKNCSGDSTKAMACMDEEKDDGVGPYVNSDEESGPMKDNNRSIVMTMHNGLLKVKSKVMNTMSTYLKRTIMGM
jgi:hypothetical protein